MYVERANDRKAKDFGSSLLSDNRRESQMGTKSADKHIIRANSGRAIP